MRRSAFTLPLLTILLGCVPGSGAGSEDGLHMVPPGKADNYYSSVAAEFEVRGDIPVQMTAEEFADEAIRADKVTRRLTAVGLYLTGYVTEKFRGIDENGDGEITEDEVFFHNEGWGGFQAMVRSYTVEPGDVIESSADGAATYVARFTLDMAGPPDLMQRIPRAEGIEAPEGELAFQLLMPAGESVDPANVPRTTFRRFDPRNYAGELETRTLFAKAQPQVGNAFPAYAGFVTDGLYDITLFFGHDYNVSRSDLSEARSAFSSLQQLGFRAPVEQFEDLVRDSGPFVRTAFANGTEITVEVRIFHSDMFEDARREQHDLALSEIVARDVFFYNGHAGPYFGFYLDEARAATVNYWEFRDAPFAADRQQLVIAQGCQTYSNYADMLYANPAKNEGNLDVITTVNYSYGEGTMELLENLIRFDDDGNHQPADFYRIIADLNENWLNSYHDVFYGVMGIDGNSQLHSYARPQAAGEECEVATDCGDPSGNVCVADPEGVKRCGARTLSAAACPEGTHFVELASGRTIEGGACF